MTVRNISRNQSHGRLRHDAI